MIENWINLAVLLCFFEGEGTVLLGREVKENEGKFDFLDVGRKDRI